MCLEPPFQIVAIPASAAGGAWNTACAVARPVLRLPMFPAVAILLYIVVRLLGSHSRRPSRLVASSTLPCCTTMYARLHPRLRSFRQICWKINMPILVGVVTNRQYGGPDPGRTGVQYHNGARAGLSNIHSASVLNPIRPSHRRCAHRPPPLSLSSRWTAIFSFQIPTAYCIAAITWSCVILTNDDQAQDSPRSANDQPQSFSTSPTSLCLIASPAS